ncbi:unnamed protein product, partial [Iphiclides podalirius]
MATYGPTCLKRTGKAVLEHRKIVQKPAKLIQTNRFYSGLRDATILCRFHASDSGAVGCKLGKLEGQSKATFAALFGLRAGGGVDLSAAYRYNQNMMEYYTCFPPFPGDRPMGAAGARDGYAPANGGARSVSQGERGATIGPRTLGGLPSLCASAALKFAGMPEAARPVPLPSPRTSGLSVP